MLICKWKINFLIYLFLITLQRNMQTCYFGQFANAWPHTPKMTVSLWRNLWGLPAVKRSSSSFTFSLQYCKDIVNLLFCILWAYLAKHTQSYILSTCRKLVFIYQLVENLCLSANKKSISSPMLFWRYWKDIYAKNILRHSLLSWDITF